MCGITAIFGENYIFSELYESLYHLQHRGQDSFGFSYLQNDNIKVLKQKGLVSNYNFNKEIKTKIGIGHVRYPTKGNNTLEQAQPFYEKGKFYTISIVHNGQIDTEYIKQKLNISDTIDKYSDSYYLCKYLSYLFDKYVIINDENIINIIKEIQTINGSFNCICIIEGYGLICFKDKYSTRPLILGHQNDKYIISSESISITSIDFDIVDDIYGNNIIIYHNDKYKKLSLWEDNLQYFKPCIFEWIYLAREESIMYGINVYQARCKMGEYLGKKISQVIDTELLDMVIPIPDTSKPVALEISKQINKPYYEAITKNRYVNRTFIMDSQNKRKKNIKRKLNVIQHLIQNKNILIIDDSIVRGNTIKHIVNLLKENNVNKIFIGICSPKIINKNKYGIDIPTKEELLCFQKSNTEIEKELDIEKIIFQDIFDMEHSIQYFKPYKIFEKSVFQIDEE